ncbi:MAG TPA: hypothetical protein VGC35_05475 [Allosphingosinicella sp.]|jgi:hypothetical protein
MNRAKHLTAFFLLLAAPLAAAAQGGELPPVDFPSLPDIAANASAFAPRGWAVETQVRGNLNGDSLPDLALVLTRGDTAPRQGQREANPNPRMLVVAWGRATGGYALAIRNTAFLPRKRPPNGLSSDWVTFEDGSLEVDHGRLRVTIEYLRGHRSFSFGWRQGALRLIGFDTVGVSGAGCMDELSINFLTRRAKMSAGWIDRDEPRPVWRALRPRPLLALKDLGDGEELDPYDLTMHFPLRCP